MGENQDALSALKTRRRGRKDAPPPPAPITSADQIITRRNPVLLDPAELPVVVESGGYVPPANLEADYVVAAIAASRQVLPDGCRTPVSQVLWMPGQHVRRDAYEAYLRDHEIVAELPDPDPAEGDQ